MRISRPRIQRRGEPGFHRSMLRVCAGLLGALIGAGSIAPPGARAGSLPIQGGVVGFVVSHIEYALSHDAAQTGACPDGMTRGYADFGEVFHPKRPPLQRESGETEETFRRRVFGSAFSDPTATNLCLSPELGEPDDRFRTVIAEGIPVFGIDLDGHDSTRSSTAPGTCAHDDFSGMDGTAGVDNQWFRVVGCSPSFQSTGQSNDFDTVLLTGAWGILITLSGVDDLRNDDSIEVGLFASADPIELSASREPLRNATYAMVQDPRYRATVEGRIVDGVVSTDPVDLRFHSYKSDLRVDRPLRDARLRATLDASGTLRGVLGGYTPVEEAYDFQYGVRDGENRSGGLGPIRTRMITAIGQAQVLGHTCEGAWQALHAHADGHPDPETGVCTSISTQYLIEAIPAFIIDEATESANEALDS